MSGDQGVRPSGRWTVVTLAFLAAFSLAALAVWMPWQGDDPLVGHAIDGLPNVSGEGGGGGGGECVAAFSYQVVADTLKLQVDASDSSGQIDGYSWTFGDGSAEQGEAATFEHEYAAAGTYTVSLSVSCDDDDDDELEAEITLSPVQTGGSGGGGGGGGGGTTPPSDDPGPTVEDDKGQDEDPAGGDPDTSDMETEGTPAGDTTAAGDAAPAGKGGSLRLFAIIGSVVVALAGIVLLVQWRLGR